MGHSSAERTIERLHYMVLPRRYREALPPALQIQLYASPSLDNTFRWTFIIGGSLDVGHLQAKYHGHNVHLSTYLSLYMTGRSWILDMYVGRY